MKRHGHLWDRMISFEALLRAADTAWRSKRFRPAVAAFHFNQERELWKLHEELVNKTYQPGEYRSFFMTSRSSGRSVPPRIGIGAALPSLFL